jgi:hypothetical protein
MQRSRCAIRRNARVCPPTLTCRIFPVRDCAVPPGLYAAATLGRGCEYPKRKPQVHYAPLEKHFQERTAEPQISPLRCASVEMTKGRLVLRGRVVAEEEPCFIALGGRRRFVASEPAAVKTIQPSAKRLFCL